MKIKVYEELKKKSPDVVNFAEAHGALALDDVLETLEDMGCLSKKGLDFRQRYWEIYVSNN